MIDLKNKKTVFAVDIDDTLYSFENVAREMLLRFAKERKEEKFLRAAYAPWDEWRTPPDSCGVDTWIEIVNACHDPDVIISQTPFAQAAETLKQISEREEYEILYISNRQKTLTDPTHYWLMANDFPVAGNELICVPENKMKYIKHCTYLIDDRPRTLMDFIYTGGKYKKGIALMHPFNRALTDIPNIFLSPTWGGIKNWMERKEIL